MTNKIPSLVALKLISIHLADFKINHALGGSGLLYALGLIDEVNDWDITTDAKLEAVLPALQGLDWKRIPSSEMFKSDYLIKINLDGAQIDLIGGFAIKKSSNSLHKVPVKISNYWNDIPLAAPYHWLDAYKAMERNHRVLLLEEYLKKG